MANEDFTLVEVQLLEDAAAALYNETSRKISEQERIPTTSPLVRNQVNLSKEQLNQKMDDISMLRAKLIIKRAQLNNPSAQEESGN